MNVVDVVAVLPFFVILALQNVGKAIGERTNAGGAFVCFCILVSPFLWQFLKDHRQQEGVLVVLLWTSCRGYPVGFILGSAWKYKKRSSGGACERSLLGKKASEGFDFIKFHTAPKTFKDPYKTQINCPLP